MRLVLAAASAVAATVVATTGKNRLTTMRGDADPLGSASFSWNACCEIVHLRIDLTPFPGPVPRNEREPIRL